MHVNPSACELWLIFPNIKVRKLMRKNAPSHLRAKTIAPCLIGVVGWVEGGMFAYVATRLMYYCFESVSATYQEII